MLITAVIPSYNHARFVGRAIESVLAQTRPVDELIVVDDGSQDDTREVVAGFGDRVRYIFQQNRGLSAARNQGWREARHPWIAFLDADDWWLPDKIALQTRQLSASPQAALCYTGVVYEFAGGSQRVNPATDPNHLWPTLRYRNCVTGSGSAVCVRRQALAEIGGFREDLSAYEDWDAWFRLAKRWPFVAVPEPVTGIRILPRSMSSKPDRMLRNMEIVVDSTLVADLTGWRRTVWRRRIRSSEFYRMALIARDARPAEQFHYFWQSVREWPSPFFRFVRFKALAFSLVNARSSGYDG